MLQNRDFSSKSGQLPGPFLLFPFLLDPNYTAITVYVNSTKSGKNHYSSKIQ